MTEPLSPAPIPAPEPAKKKAAAKRTEYVVFEPTSEQDTWRIIDNVSAKSPDDAIEIAVAAKPEDEQAGTYAAVAEARWNPGEITPKVERSLVLKRAKS